MRVIASGLVILFFLTAASAIDPCADELIPIEAKSIRSTKNAPDRFFVSKGTVIYNGTSYPQFKARRLKSGTYTIVARPAPQPRARLVLLHGLGLATSNVGSVIPTARLLYQIGSRPELPLARWFVDNHPELHIPLEIAAFDLPSAGWAPPYSDFRSALDVGDYVARAIAELNESDPLPTFAICRSASCAFGILAAHRVRGLVLTSGTYPDGEVLEFNRSDLAEQERQKKAVARWDVIDPLTQHFLAPELLKSMQKALMETQVPVLSLYGKLDTETPERARDLWQTLIPPHSSPLFRSHHLLDGAGHHVYLRPKDSKEGVFSTTDSDILALRLTLEFIAHHTSK